MDPTVEASLIGIAGTVIGVGGTVIVAVTSARNARLTNQATIDSAHADSNFTLEATREAQYADRYSRALEQLGSENLDVRIGGIYALEGIALDSPRQHPTVMEVLTAFIREHARTDPGAERPARWPLPDVQAALTVVGRRKSDHDIRPMDLNNTDLSGGDLTGANLNGANLMNVNFTRAILTVADLTKAVLWAADFTGAIVTSTTFAAAQLVRANLSGANLIGAKFVFANLTSANLTNAELLSADLTNADLTGAKLVAANFTNARLDGACWPDGVEVPEGWLNRSGRLKPVRETTEPTTSGYVSRPPGRRHRGVRLEGASSTR
jgi:uncharacterized protein YjbI with pentapeptide repeats